MILLIDLHLLLDISHCALSRPYFQPLMTLLFVTELIFLYNDIVLPDNVALQNIPF